VVVKGVSIRLEWNVFRISDITTCSRHFGLAGSTTTRRHDHLDCAQRADLHHSSR